MIKINVLGGANQIGGNCVKIEGKSSKIILDIGVPLTDKDAKPIDINLTNDNLKNFTYKINDLCSGKIQKETLIFLSHAHPDHFGLARYRNKRFFDKNLLCRSLYCRCLCL